MAYRNKPDLYGTPPTPVERRQMRYVFWLFPLILVGPHLGRIANMLGFKASRPSLLYGTIAMGAICIVGAIASYRNAKATAARDVAELINRDGR